MKTRVHPWKICPIGSYYVKAHHKTIGGKKHLWGAHCRNSKTMVHIFNHDEIEEISRKFFTSSLSLPKKYDFGVKNRGGNEYDILIAGWVAFWTELLNIESAITPDFVKVLIMSESSFRTEVKAKTHDNPGHAIGLMQITTNTLKLMHEGGKELRDTAFAIKTEHLQNPTVNICLGIRWLFRKREIAKAYYKAEPTHLQLAEEYKGIRNDKSIAAKNQRDKFEKLWKEYDQFISTK